jgi:hypothetical protein
MLAFFALLLACSGAPADSGATAADDTGCDAATDADCDGFAVADGDCADDDATVNPDAAEVCDGTDQDCDGDVDEGAMTAWFPDTDGDGYGDPNMLEKDACEDPSSTGHIYVADDTDCDDHATSIHPGADELCDDAYDNDCDGDVDEADCVPEGA